MCLFVTKAVLVSQGLWDLLLSPHSGAITPLAVTHSKETWQLSRCVPCVCATGCLLINSCVPLSLQVSLCWCLTGGSQKTLPGKCTWASTRRTAGEGLLQRRYRLLLRLLSFNLSALHHAYLIHLPVTQSCLVLLPNKFLEHTKENTLSQEAHKVTRNIHILAYRCTCPHPVCSLLSSCRHHRGGDDVS